MRRLFSLIALVTFTISCTNTTEEKNEASTNTEIEASADSATVKQVEKDSITISKNIESVDINDTAFVKMAYPELFIYDMRYADTNNFLHKKVYECPQCLLRHEVVEKLLNANEYFHSLGFQIVLFDCYRPLSVQKKMWKILPDGRYVANPKNGSIHNRGGAVDISLATLDGEYLDMGTDFDHFGKEAHIDYTTLPDTIISNRMFLREGMEKNDFTGIRTEWWHFNALGSKSYPVSDFSIRCN